MVRQPAKRASGLSSYCMDLHPISIRIRANRHRSVVLRGALCVLGQGVYWRRHSPYHSGSDVCVFMESGCAMRADFAGPSISNGMPPNRFRLRSEDPFCIHFVEHRFTSGGED